MAEGWLGAQAPPRPPLPGLPPSPAARPRAPVQGAGAAAGAAQHDWPGRCEPVLRQPASGASGWTTLQACPAAALP